MVGEIHPEVQEQLGSTYKDLKLLHLTLHLRLVQR